MYPAQWATPDRIHSVEEASIFPFREAKDADLYLAILDSYDVLLSGVEGEIPVSKDLCEKLRERITETLVFRYDELSGRIPGRLKVICQARRHSGPQPPVVRPERPAPDSPADPT